MINRFRNLIYKLKNFKIKYIEIKQEELIKSGYFSQYGQDKFIAEYFDFLKKGIFVDIGANDGKTLSNTYYLEKNLLWHGIAIEPSPKVFQRLEKNRDCILINACISDVVGNSDFLELTGHTEMLSGLVDKYDERHIKRINDEIEEFSGKKNYIQVPCYKLEDVIRKQGLDKINYLNIDIEGGEIDVLKSIDFNNLDIDIIGVENNYKEDEIKNYLNKFGYRLIAIVGSDEMYTRKSI
jgi:FkbM family methyltransferase